MKDLTIITDVFTVTLTGLYHPRIQYPASAKTPSADEPTIPHDKKDAEQK